MADHFIDKSPAQVRQEQGLLEEAALREQFYQNRPFDSAASTPQVSTNQDGEHLETADLLNETLANLQPFIWPALLALSGFIVRAIVTKKKTKPLEFILDCLAAMIIGSLVGFAIEDMEFSQNIRYAIIAISGMVGPDLAGGIIILGQAFKESPTDFLIKHYKAIKGEKVEPEKDKKSMTYEEWDKANKDFIDQTFSSPTDGKHM